LEGLVLKISLIKRAALIPAVFALLATGAFATTINFNGTVTLTPAAPPAGSIFPAVGTAGMVSLEVDDSDPSVLLFDLGRPIPYLQTLRASVSVPGILSGSMFSIGDFWDYSASALRFGAYGPAVLATPGPTGYFPTGRHSFQLNYAAGVAQPQTVGELVMALMAPGTSGFFSHEMDRQGGGFFFTRVEFSNDMSAVPLPGSLPLMLGALLAGASLLVRRSRAVAI
jgi:hypothetical protein